MSVEAQHIYPKVLTGLKILTHLFDFVGSAEVLVVAILWPVAEDIVQDFHDTSLINIITVSEELTIGLTRKAGLRTWRRFRHGIRSRLPTVRGCCLRYSIQTFMLESLLSPARP